ncbi:MAG: HPP family protein [Trebonia sp.]
MSAKKVAAMGEWTLPVPSPFIQLPTLAAQHSRRLVYTVFVSVAGGTSIGVIAALAYWSHSPLVVPSLGPTAFLVFNRSQSIVARPRNAVLGHLIGVLAGYVALLVFDLDDAPNVVEGGVSAGRIGAAALSIALTSAAMILLRTEHGPAGATTLIVSLGFMTGIVSLFLLMAGVVALVAEGVLIDRLVGLDLPYWSDHVHVHAPRHGHGHGHGRRRGPQRPAGLLAFTPDPPSILDGGYCANEDHDGDGGKAMPPAKQPAGPKRPGSPYVVGPQEGRRVEVGGEQCTVKVDHAKAQDAYAVLELTLNPRQPATMLHVHPAFAETYCVLEGTVAAEIGAERVRAGVGSVISVPPGVPHVLNCASREPARCLCITAKSAQSHPEFLP